MGLSTKPLGQTGRCGWCGGTIRKTARYWRERYPDGTSAVMHKACADEMRGVRDRPSSRPIGDGGGGRFVGPS